MPQDFTNKSIKIFRKRFCFILQDDGELGKKGDILCDGTGILPPHLSAKDIESFLIERLEAQKEEFLSMVEGMNNFRQAKVDGKDEWNSCLEQCAAKVDALIKELKEN